MINCLRADRCLNKSTSVCGDCEGYGYYEPITHYVHCNSGGALFVKEAEFFCSQGGLVEEWGGKTWIPVKATSIGDARRQASKILGVPLSHIHEGEQDA